LKGHGRGDFLLSKKTSFPGKQAAKFVKPLTGSLKSSTLWAIVFEEKKVVHLARTPFIKPVEYIVSAQWLVQFSSGCFSWSSVEFVRNFNPLSPVILRSVSHQTVAAVTIVSRQGV